MSTPSEGSPPPDSSSPSPPTPPTSSPPPPSNSGSSPPPPSNSGSSPPPPSPTNSGSSPPPPSNSGSSPPPNSSSPPPPSNNNNNNSNTTSPPPSNNNNNDGNNNRSPPPPRSNGDSRSPPPPPRSGSNPRNDSPNQLSDSPSNNNSSSNENAIIIGASVGAGLILLIMIVFLISCARRKKRKHHNHMSYYMDNSQGNTGDANYYNHGPPPHGNWNSNGEHMVKIPPPPVSGQVSSEHSWPIAPPPPPPMMTSSEMSSAAFSGPHQAPMPPPHPAMALGYNQSSFSYDDLAAATGGFAQANLLGQGGFGYVHKGVLPNGKEIAVKSLKANSGQGEREFQAEVDIISRVHHRHLVSLVGYCIAGSQRMLVYEYVPNGTLEYHLHVTPDRPTMNWATRLKIALGSAKGFAYLHEDCHPRIIHRDIKAANILLDSDFEAKVADFGLAKLSSDNFTHVSTRIMGTFGYLAPEYASSGKLTEKSDVYSYGIMLLELITGRRPIDMSSDDDGLVDWARPILMQVAEGGSHEELIDPRLGHNYDPQEMLRMVASAAACIRHSARRRPKMSQIVRALEGDYSLEEMNEGGVKTVQTAMFGSSGSSSSYTDLAKFRKAAGLSSQEFTSSEHGLTGEFVRSNDGDNSSEMHPTPPRPTAH